MELEALDYVLNRKDVKIKANSYRFGTGSHNGHAQALEDLALLVEETLSDFRNNTPKPRKLQGE